MPLNLCVLASGSRGNCTVVHSASTVILVDAGLSARETFRRLEQAGIASSRVGGILVSHEHGDHTAGLKVLNTRHGIKVFANSGTVQGLESDSSLAGLKWQVFSTGYPFQVGDITVEPFSVPHDAYEPVGFVLTCGLARVAVATDMGVPTALVKERLKRCQALVVEANHDVDMLKNANRPWPLKQRIQGRQGHLSNDSAAEMLAEVASPELRHVFLAHLSEDCNTGDLALGTVRHRLVSGGHAHVKLSLTYPEKISDTWSFESL